MNVLRCVSSLAESTGGPAVTIPTLTSYLSQEGIRNHLICLDNSYPMAETKSFASLTTINKAEVNFFNPLWVKRFYLNLENICKSKKIDVIHNHGLWLGINHQAALLSSRLKIPMVTTPHGMLTSWAFNHNRWKKQIAWFLYQRRDLLKSAVIHTTSVSESEDIQKFGYLGSIAMIPHGLEPSPITATHLTNKKIRVALFLSRINPKKGLIHLVEAWAKLHPNQWELWIAGFDESGYQKKIEELVKTLQIAPSIFFKGPVFGNQKWTLYKQADLFILPTFSENFGFAIAEALSSGLPVITTHGTPWSELLEKKCGWWIPIGTEPLIIALKEAIQLAPEQRRTMGQEGQRLIHEKYSWKSAAKHMKQLYEWILNPESSPSFISKKSKS
jgi:glycosyltransferase involved in cell wall biosynthesis